MKIPKFKENEIVGLKLVKQIVSGQIFDIRKILFWYRYSISVEFNIIDRSNNIAYKQLQWVNRWEGTLIKVNKI